jgi:Ca2+-binding EF-hand superfamily protein
MNTQAKAVFEQMVAKASTLTVEELKRVLTEDSINPELPTVVFDTMLNALEGMISEEEFIEFCDSL